MVIRFLASFLAILSLAGCNSRSTDEISLAEFGYTPEAAACLSEALYFEARGTDDAGLRAVAEVILNRAASPEFPDTVCGVIDQRYNGSCQFSYRCDSIPNDVFNEPQEKARIDAIALQMLTNRGEDITNGALFFHAASMAPGWFGTLNRRGQFGGNIFYQ